ncbi:hypothetical protein E4T43_04157 [Aureobasidium subglaciale]|nr:hypothetical protein E4T43_04157 [Aureobasidium subglaciale]
MSDTSSPAVASQQQKKSFYQRSRQATLDSIASDTNYDWLFQNIRFFLEYPQQVYLLHELIRTDEELEQQLQLLWFKTIEAAKVFAADDEARQYKLVAWIAAARARENVQSTTQKPFVADGGKVMWRDLPFFEVALEEAWGGRASLSKDAWTNLNAFVSRLAAVTGMDLMRFGLETIREALEEERPIFPTGDGGDTGEKSVADLLPAALLWLKHTHSFMSTRLPPIERAVKDGVEPPSGCGESVTPGDLATADGVSRNGMSLTRQTFWRRRLFEIGECSGDQDPTAKDAHDFAKRMGTWPLHWPSDLRNVPGYEEPVKYDAKWVSMGRHQCFTMMAKN